MKVKYITITSAPWMRHRYNLYEVPARLLQYPIIRYQIEIAYG